MISTSSTRSHAKSAPLLVARYPILFFSTMWMICGVIISLAETRILEQDFLGSADPFSFRLIFDSLARFATHGDADLGGFMLAFEEDVHVATVKIIDDDRELRDVYPYISNFNLQYILAKYLVLILKDAEIAVYILAFTYFVAMSLVIAAICKFALEKFSLLSSLITLLCFTLSTQFVARSLHIYWMTFLYFLPFLFMLIYYGNVSPRNQFGRCSLVVGLLVFLNSLRGYEYLTTITIGAMLPIVYYELEGAKIWNRETLLKIILRSAGIGLAAVVGFVCAAFMHVAKAAVFFGDISKGFQALMIPFSYSTLHSVGDIRRSSEISLYALALPFLRTAARNASIFAMIFIFCMPFIFSGIKAKQIFIESLSHHERAWFVTSFVALFGSISWFIAFKHAAVHPHINWIIFYMYCIPCFAICAAVLLEKTLPHRGDA